MLPFRLFAFLSCSHEIYGVCSFHFCHFRPASLSRGGLRQTKYDGPLSTDSYTIWLLLSWLLRQRVKCGAWILSRVRRLPQLSEIRLHSCCKNFHAPSPPSPCRPHHRAEYIFRPKRKLQFAHPPSVIYCFDVCRLQDLPSDALWTSKKIKNLRLFSC